MINYKTKAEDLKLASELAKCKYKCKNCGHIVIIARQSKALCSHCGNWVFKNDTEEFKYRLMEKMRAKI